MAKSSLDLDHQTEKGDYSGRLSSTAEAFRSNEDFFRTVVNNLEDYSIFTTDVDGVITSWNLGAHRLFGYSEEDIIGEPIHRIYVKSDREEEIPEQEMEIALEQGKATDERWHLRKDGSKFFAFGLIVPLKEEGKHKGYTKVVRDLTERHQAEQEAREARKYAESIVDTIFDPLLVLDKNLQVNSANHAYFEIFNTSGEEVVGKDVFKLGDGQWNVAELQYLLESILPHEEMVRDYEITHDFSHIGHRTMLLNARALKLPDKEMVLLVIRDITTLKNLEQQKDDFVSMVSHELRTPLTTIKLYVQMFEEALADKSAGDEVEFTQRIERQVDRLTVLLRDIMDVGKLESGKFELDTATVDLNTLVRRVLKEFRDTSPGHLFELKGKIDDTVEADPARLEQVLNNLITNAVKYSPNSDLIKVSMTQENEVARVSVQDFGVGISKDSLNKVFDRYFREEASSQAGGFGLGLYIAKEIVERHGGEIDVRSSKGEGSTFFFTLPLQ